MTEHGYKVGGRRMMLLCEGHFGSEYAKTATGLSIWCPDEVVAVIDRETAGQKVEDLIGFGEGIPIVRTLEEAVKLGGTQLVIGVANVGGVLVPGYREVIVRAIKLGCDVVSGLHEILSEDAELVSLAEKHGVKIYDVRLVPKVPVGMNRARTVGNRRVLAVGTDCATGKKCTALVLTREFAGRGLDAKFVATGQTGIMIEGDGLCIDRAIGDFASGVAEKLVLDNADRDWLFIEGQGSLDHPSYSGVTLSLLHGTAPQALVLCHIGEHTGRRHDDGSPLMSVAENIRLHETVSTPILPTKVVGLSLMTRGLSEADAKREIRKLEDETGLPATDPLRFGVRNLADALIEFFDRRPHGTPHRNPGDGRP